MVSIDRVDRHGGTPWMQTIYQTQALTDQNGRAPERVLARQVATAFDDIGVDCQVYYDYPAVQAGTQRASCSAPPESHDTPVVDSGVGTVSDPPHSRNGFRDHTSARNVLVDHLENDDVVAVADSNVILTAWNGGGCAGISGNVGSAGGGGIENDPGGRVISGDGALHDSVSSSMHEIGHNMGNTHADNGGLAWNESGNWHTTPTASRYDVPDGGGQNLCGEEIPEREATSLVDELWYPECQVEVMDVVEKPPLAGRPASAPATVDGEFVAFAANRAVGVDGWDAAYGGGGITRYEYDMGDGEVMEGPVGDYTYDEPGVYTVTLTVTGFDGSADSASVDVDATQNGGVVGPGGGLDIGAGEVAVAGGLFMLLLLARPENRPEELFGD